MPGEDDGQRLGSNNRLVPGEDDGRLALGDERPAAWRLGRTTGRKTSHRLGFAGSRLEDPASDWVAVGDSPGEDRPPSWEQAREDTTAATIPHADLISLKAATTNRYVYNGSAGNFVEKVTPTAKKSTSRAAVAIELEKSYFFGSTLVKVYLFGWYLGFSESKSKFRSPTKGTLNVC